MFLYLGRNFVLAKVTLPSFIGDRKSLQYTYMKNKLPVQMVDTIEMDDEQLKAVFKKSNPPDPPVFIKVKDVWIYAPSINVSLSEVKVNQIIDWGIMPEKSSAIDLQPCKKPDHGFHDYLSPFHFENQELLGYYERIYSTTDEDRKRGIAENYRMLRKIHEDKIGHENTCFHCPGHPFEYSNYKETDWTIRLYYAIKDHLGDICVRPSYLYASNYNFPALQQQISSCPASSIYLFKGAPDLLFTKKKTAEAASLLTSDEEVELLDLKEEKLSFPKITRNVNLPNVAGQMIAGLHFLAVAKTLKYINSTNTVPSEVKSKGLLVKRKDAMWLYTLTATINEVGLASVKIAVEDINLYDNFTVAHLCAAITHLMN